MTKKEKLENNIKAIEIAFEYSKTKKPLTIEQKEILKKYTGFGEFKFILLDPQKPELFPQNEKLYISYVEKLHKIFRDYSTNIDEYNKYVNSIKASVLTAFYTSKSIVNAINSSFKKNNIFFDKMLDPSAGNGIFLGIDANEHIAIEKDLITGKILQALHPKSDIYIEGFEEIKPKFNNSFDIISSNIPFGDFKVFDPILQNSQLLGRRQATNSIHTYFFEKALDMLKNGGVLAFITSTGVMDAQKNENFRKHILNRANLISAIRLPQGTFDSTKVQSDLIILQKNENRNIDKISEQEKKFLISSETSQLKNFSYNNYLHDKVNIIYTNEEIGTNLYGEPSIIYTHSGNIDGISRDLENILIKDIRMKYDYNLMEKVEKEKEVAKLYSRQIRQRISLKNNYIDKQLSLFDDNFIDNENNKELNLQTYFSFKNFIYNLSGSLQTDENFIGYAENSERAKIIPNLDSKEIELLKAYIILRDSYFELKNFEIKNQKASEILREKLNTNYDDFLKNYGTIYSLKDKLNIDTAFKEILGIEFIENNQIKKSDIFFEPIAFTIDKDKFSIEDALSISLNKFNKVDLDYISNLSKIESKEDIIKKLDGKIYLNAESKMYEPADLFLSGNVIEKFEYNRKIYNETGNNNLLNSMKALREIFPTKIPFEEIDISLGERWIPEQYINLFATEKFEVEMNIKYYPELDHFSISGIPPYSANQKYGVRSENRYYSADKVLNFAIINNTPEMNKKIYSDGKEIIVPDTEGIQKMNSIITLIQKEFKQWLQELDFDSKLELENIYNYKFNCFVKAKFDGAFQTFPDLDYKNLGIKELYKSQKDAILLLKNMNGGIIDHEVGGGKTLIQCIAAYEMKRLGLANKPVILGLKANIEGISKTFSQAYPNAKILYATDKEFAKEKREVFFNKIQNNNWDCIIMTHDQFKSIPQSVEIQRQILQEEINKIEDVINSIEKNETNYRKLIKGLEVRKQNLEVKIKDITWSINNKKDKIIDFKTMGIDHLFIDESHKFKNLMFQTRHQRVAGLGNSNGSERSLNLLFAIRTIQEKNNGKDLGATFLSGTTLSNSLTELYNIFNYLRPQALKKQNIFSFDAWIATYAEKTKDFEISVTNNIIQKERFRKFIKVPELATFYSQITDYKTADDINIDRPKQRDLFIALNKTPQQIDMFNRLQIFAKTSDGTIIYREPLNAREEKAKMLIATNTARKASLDMRLINNELFTDEENNKVNIISQKIFEYYNKYNEQKGTQFVFSDIGTFKPGKDFNIYTEIKDKLVKMGILEKEIKFIQTATTRTKKEKMINEMNNGECRVIFGSTEMLGTGVNAQKRCVAIHHFDIPWTPKDLEQRNGRGVRTGNIIAKEYANNYVDVLTYATKETLDTYKFSLLKNKIEFIKQIKNNNISIRSIDEGGVDNDGSMNFSEYIAILSGNTDLLEKAKLEKIIAALKLEQTMYDKQLREKEIKIIDLTNQIKANHDYISKFQEDLIKFNAIPRDKDEKPLIEFIIEGEKMTNQKKIGEALNKILSIENKDSFNYRKIGSYGDFNLVIKSDIIMIENGNDLYANKIFVEGNLKYSYNNGNLAKDPIRASEYPANALNKIVGLIDIYKLKNKEAQDKIDVLQKLDLKFLNKDKLEESIKQLETINNKINKSIIKDKIEERNNVKKYSF